MGEIRARGILANVNARLVTCFDIDAPRCQQFASRFGCRAADSIADAISDPQVKAVFVCTISGTHVELITQTCKVSLLLFAPNFRSLLLATYIALGW
jgi:predicted dehydrogenase